MIRQPLRKIWPRSFGVETHRRRSPSPRRPRNNRSLTTNSKLYIEDVHDANANKIYISSKHLNTSYVIFIKNYIYKQLNISRKFARNDPHMFKYIYVYEHFRHIRATLWINFMRNIAHKHVWSGHAQIYTTYVDTEGPRPIYALEFHTYICRVN